MYVGNRFLLQPRGPCTEKAQFGLCTNENHHEFFFDTEKRKCRSKARQLPPSCLAGQNRFKSFRDCRLACLDQVRTDPWALPFLSSLQPIHSSSSSSWQGRENIFPTRMLVKIHFYFHAVNVHMERTLGIFHNVSVLRLLLLQLQFSPQSICAVVRRHHNTYSGGGNVCFC